MGAKLSTLFVGRGMIALSAIALSVGTTAIAQEDATAQGEAKPTSRGAPISLITTSEPAPLIEPAPAATPSVVDPSVVDPVAVSQPTASPSGMPAPLPKAQKPAAEIEDPDNAAASLNARQKIQQEFVLERRIDGKVVSRERKKLEYTPSRIKGGTPPERPTLETLSEEFDRKLLTRTEAFEEAKVDFRIADLNQDDQLSEDEYVLLLRGWHDNADRSAQAPSEELARQRKIDDFLSEIDPHGRYLHLDEAAKRKFRFITGAALTIHRKDFVREYLTDFDAMDHNQDSMLEGLELQQFRAIVRGENIYTQ